MLQLIQDENFGDEIEIVGAPYPLPFIQELEFNAPVHETWNIVHIGMLVPETIQVYVCGKNCMRGVVLTAAEMNALDRFSSVVLTDEDLVQGTIEDVTIQGIADVVRKAKKRPKGVLVFTVCAHHFLACDTKRIYRELEAMFPDITFFQCWMDPIMQKQGITPDQKLRRAMYQKLPELPPNNKVVSLLGTEFALDETSDLQIMLQQNGYELRQLPTCKTFADFQKLAEGTLLLATFPPGEMGAKQAAIRLNRPFQYIPSGFTYEEVDAQLQAVAEILGIPMPDTAPLQQKVEEALADLKALIGNTPIAIDYISHPRTLGLAKLLLTHGFRVDTIYIDAINAEEEDIFYWLQEHYPQLKLSATVHPYKRLRNRGREEKVLAVGPKAAWFEDTAHFVNMVSGAGLYGYNGMVHMIQLMKEAYLEEKDTEDLVPRKGLGCGSCV